MTAHISRPRYSQSWRAIVACPACRQRRRMTADYAKWYGVTLTCCGCGSLWQDGEMTRASERERSSRAAHARGRWPELARFSGVIVW